MDNKTEHGYLTLADISGYSAFVAKSELEHAHDILSELLESTYAGFRDHQEAIRRRTTCLCAACSNIASLDLKFMVHYGDYIVQNIGGHHEMVGNDVNLIHRLLKNQVAEEIGGHGYALFTDQALRNAGLKPEAFHEMSETYDIGEVNIFVSNLDERYQTLRDLRRVIVQRSEADLVYEFDYPAPPPVVWDWLNDPQKRLQWEYADRRIFPFFMPKGRTSVGAVNHCMPGEIWR